MHLAATIARYLLGVIFLVFGLNGFAHFIPQPPAPALAMQYYTMLYTTHLYVVIFAAQILVAVLLLAGRFVPLALVILAPILVNIWAFHILLAPASVPPAILVTILWVLVALDNRRAFDGILTATSPAPPTRA